MNLVTNLSISFVLAIATNTLLLNDESPANELVDVFVPVEDGYPAIRIPSLVTAQSGTLLAFAEGRQGGDHSENDIILKRSLDGGETWGPLITVNDQGILALNNPQAVVLDSGQILLMYQRSRLGEHKASSGSGPDSYFTFTQTSNDEGLTWSEPADVSDQVKRSEIVTSVSSGPGIGIVLRRGKYKGRIIMPFNQGPFGDWRVYAAFSNDDGLSWQMGNVAEGDGKGHGNEVQMVELSDGRLMLNARTQGQGGTKHRKIALSVDGGQSWSPLEIDRSLIDPVCQASILRYSWPEEVEPRGSGGRILFANPHSQSGRENGMLQVSSDEGVTWSVHSTIYPGGFAYCCLTKLNDGRVGVLFERDEYKAISFLSLEL